MVVFKILVLVFSTISQVYGHVGDECVIKQEQGNDIPGSCKLFKDCATAIADIKNNQFPKVCGFQESEPIVCCSNNSRAVGSNNSRAVGQISREKCKEYGQSVFELVEMDPLILGSNVVTRNISQCVIDSIPLITDNSRPGEFPHMAALGFVDKNDTKWKCSGALISDQFVLTAAHCLYGRDIGPVSWVRLGSQNLDEESTVGNYKVEKIIRHPDYKPPSLYNDIGLIKLDRTVDFNKFIRPACLQTTYSISASKYINTGWSSEPFQRPSNGLHKVHLLKFDEDQCNLTYQDQISGRRLKYGIVSESQLCANKPGDNKDSCLTHDEGPLQIYDKEVYCMYDIIGVGSFGRYCGAHEFPSVFTRVSHYIHWIEENVWPET